MMAFGFREVVAAALAFLATLAPVNAASSGLVASGDYNTVSTYAFVGGGSYNSAGGQWSTIAGGYTNSASGSWSAVAGGYANTASGMTSTIVGGHDNLAAGIGAGVNGGWSNTVYEQ